MKRLISATLIASTLALSLGATAASAQSYRHGGYGGGYGHGGYSRGYGGYGGYRHDDTGALVGLGFGLFALGAIAAASNHDRYYDQYGYGPPPPPPPAYRYGPAYGYGSRY